MNHLEGCKVWSSNRDGRHASTILWSIWLPCFHLSYLWVEAQQKLIVEQSDLCAICKPWKWVRCLLEILVSFMQAIYRYMQPAIAIPLTLLKQIWTISWWAVAARKVEIETLTLCMPIYQADRKTFGSWSASFGCSNTCCAFSASHVAVTMLAIALFVQCQDVRIAISELPLGIGASCAKNASFTKSSKSAVVLPQTKEDRVYCLALINMSNQIKSSQIKSLSCLLNHVISPVVHFASYQAPCVDLGAPSLHSPLIAKQQHRPGPEVAWQHCKHVLFCWHWPQLAVLGWMLQLALLHLLLFLQIAGKNLLLEYGWQLSLTVILQL